MNTVIYLFSSENAGKMIVRYFVAMKREKLSLRKRCTFIWSYKLN